MPRLLLCLVLLALCPPTRADWIRNVQEQALRTGASAVVHWGPDPDRYSSWTNHTNRLVPVYAYGTAGAGPGIDLLDYTGENSPYRDHARLSRLYQADEALSVCDSAEYMDQTNIYDMQLAALRAGKKHVILVVFDGMDWQTTFAAAVHNLQRVAYSEGRGEGTHFQEYQADGTTQFGWMVTSPARDDARVNVDTQEVRNPGGGLAGGYNSALAGELPWSVCREPEYVLGKSVAGTTRHAYTDSSSAATSMTCGIKTFNGGVGVDLQGNPVPSIAHLAQSEGYRVGVVTSVPISHATPASAYAHNVSRDDYQDLSRDLLGLPSVSHPDEPLPGLDVVIGCGDGVNSRRDGAQGKNFEPGNKYLTKADAQRLLAEGNYLISHRRPGVAGGRALYDTARRAAAEGKRLFGFFGLAKEFDKDDGHLPFQSADGGYDPASGVDGGPHRYTRADIRENPTLAQMTASAITVLGASGKPFWLMVEAGDVDWANHSNNLDASIGAVNSGDDAVRVITDWVERRSNWDETVLIVTADHGHYLMIDDPELLIDHSAGASASAQNAAR